MDQHRLSSSRTRVLQTAKASATRLLRLLTDCCEYVPVSRFRTLHSGSLITHMRRALRCSSIARCTTSARATHLVLRPCEAPISAPSHPVHGRVPCELCSLPSSTGCFPVRTRALFASPGTEVPLTPLPRASPRPVSPQFPSCTTRPTSLGAPEDVT